MLSLYDTILRKIQLESYPEKILYSGLLSDELIDEMIKYFKSYSKKRKKKYMYNYEKMKEYDYINYVNIDYFSNSLSIKKNKIRSLKHLCFNNLYKNNEIILKQLRCKIPYIVFKDLGKVIKSRDNVYDYEESLSTLTLDKNIYKTKLITQPMYKIHFREYVNTNDYDGIDKLKVNMLCCVKIKCKIVDIDRNNNLLTIKSKKISNFRYLEEYIENNYLNKQYTKSSSIIDNKLIIRDFKNKIYSIPGFDAFGIDCLTKINYYNVFLYLFVIINKNKEWQVMYVLNGILECNNLYMNY